MSAFAAALAVLYADPNLSAAADYTLAAGGPPIKDVRVLLSTLDGPGAPASASIMASSLEPYGRPRKGDTLDLKDGRRFRAEDAELDTQGLEWTMRLSTIRP